MTSVVRTLDLHEHSAASQFKKLAATQPGMFHTAESYDAESYACRFSPEPSISSHPIFTQPSPALHLSPRGRSPDSSGGINWSPHRAGHPAAVAISSRPYGSRGQAAVAAPRHDTTEQGGDDQPVRLPPVWAVALNSQSLLYS